MPTDPPQTFHSFALPKSDNCSVTRRPQTLWIWENHQMIKKQITYAQGFYKIFNDVLVNAADAKQRDPTMNSVKVNIDVANNSISVWDNSNCIPVVDIDVHNYPSAAATRWISAPCENSLFTEFTIETVNEECLRVKKVLKGNQSAILTDMCESSHKGTMISFKPDLSKFSMECLEDDIVGLMKRRVVDLAGCLGNCVKVELNGTLLPPLQTFEDYVKLYPRRDTLSFYEKVNDVLEISLVISDGQFEQVSFVNNFATMKGGSHVDYITSQITSYLAERLDIEPNHIKSCLWVFVNARIETPTFASQTNQNLINKKGSFGSMFKLTPQFLEKIENSDVVKTLSRMKNFGHHKSFKKTHCKRKSNLHIPKLKDASCAATNDSKKCTLILTHGDSAKAFARSGLSIMTQKQYYGMFPLKGRLLNVREASRQKIQKNTDLQNIKMILGLEDDKNYENVRELRYGRLMIIADQDEEGSYFIGLLINFLHLFWPSLLKVPNFIYQLRTPIQGLRLFSTEEVAECFAHLDDYSKFFSWADDEDGYAIELAFNNMKIGEKMEWLVAHQVEINKFFSWADDEDGYAIELSNMKIGEKLEWLLAHQVDHIRYRDFINKEIILFSSRTSIPSMVDGLKPGQRTILFFAFKESEPIIEEIQVSQFSSYVSVHSAHYHRVESLVDNIIGMAGNYVGSNNINLLQPKGKFSTHLMGYNFIELSPITRYIFHKADESLLNYLNDDGQSSEPQWFIPIIPMVLVNGSEGRGAGCGVFIPSYNPRDIIANIKRLMNDEAMVPMRPWYKGFQGNIKKKTASSLKDAGYTSTGIMKKDNNKNTLSITELPVRRWTEEYEEFLRAGKDGTEPFIKDYTAHNDVKTVHFEIVLTEDQVDATHEDLLEKFELITTLSTANMYLFDSKGVLKKYDTPEQILEDFYGTRLEVYSKRKKAQLWELKKAALLLNNKVNYLSLIMNREIRLVNGNSDEFWAELKAKGLKKVSEVEDEVADEVAAGEEKPQGNTSKTDPATEYRYLLSIPLTSWNHEMINQLNQEINTTNDKIDALTSERPESLWLTDLEELDDKLRLYRYPAAESPPEIAEEAPKKAPAKRAAASPLPQMAKTKRLKP